MKPIALIIVAVLLGWFVYTHIAAVLTVIIVLVGLPLGLAAYSVYRDEHPRRRLRTWEEEEAIREMEADAAFEREEWIQFMADHPDD